MQVILPFLSRLLVISGFLADTRLPLAKPAHKDHFIRKYNVYRQWCNCKKEGAFCRR